MITFIILLTILLAVLFVVTLVAVACGASLLVLFGDLIVFGLIIWLIVRLCKRRR